ncbi:MAG: kelch repeat-containing protein [Planctomycetota bacterium]
MKLARSLTAVALLAPAALAQDLCEGNGYGEAYIEVGPAYLGGFFAHDIGSPALPNGIQILSISGGFTETTHPVIGDVCLDVTSPFYQIIVLPTGPDGNLHIDLFLPDIPEWVSNPPFYSNIATFEGGQWSMSKTIPLWFENPNSWTPVSSMSANRIYHTATNLGADGRDNRIRILITGGGEGTVTVPIASQTTEIFDPLSRTFSPGPDLSVERSTHTATRLDDGRVLIVGGLDTNGVCHATCEIFDLNNSTMTPAASMGTPRSGHTATLLDDGRVLVTGGFADYQNPGTAWLSALITSQNTGEIYDPVTDTWTPLAGPMASKRSGHTATKMDDGRVLIVGGVDGGFTISFGTTVAPSFTGTCEIFDPADDSLTPVASLPGFGNGERAFHAAALLGNGDVIVTGGNYNGGGNGEAVSSNSSVVFDGTSWSVAPPLPVEVAWHTMKTLPDGRALVCGGLTLTEFDLTPKAFAAAIDGTTYTPLSPVGLNEGLPASAPITRGAMAAVEMHDGAFLFTGGVDTAVLSNALIYTPNP